MAKQLTMDAADDIEATRIAGEREKRDILIRYAANDTKKRLTVFSHGKARTKMEIVTLCDDCRFAYPENLSRFVVAVAVN
jgi:hypothetical protein